MFTHGHEPHGANIMLADIPAWAQNLTGAVNIFFAIAGIAVAVGAAFACRRLERFLRVKISLVQKDLTSALENVVNEPISTENIPAAVREYLDAQQAQFEELGFSRAADVVVRYLGQPIYTRFLAAAARPEFVEINVLKQGRGGGLSWRDTKAAVLVTVFEDGVCMQSSSLNVQQSESLDTPQLVIRSRPGLTPYALLEDHRRAATAYEVEHNTRAICYPPDQVAEVSAYYTQYQREQWKKTHAFQRLHQELTATG